MSRYDLDVAECGACERCVCGAAIERETHPDAEREWRHVDHFDRRASDGHAPTLVVVRSLLELYSDALEAALVSCGIERKQAHGAASNAALPLAVFDDLDVRSHVAERLRLQRGFGLAISDEQIEDASVAAACVPRHRESIDGDPTAAELARHEAEIEQSIADHERSLLADPEARS